MNETWNPSDLAIAQLWDEIDKLLDNPAGARPPYRVETDESGTHHVVGPDGNAASHHFAAIQWKRYRPGDVIEQFDAPVAAVGLDKRGRMTHSQFLNPGDLFCYLPPLERIVAAVRAELPPDAGRGFDGAHDLGVRRT